MDLSKMKSVVAMSALGLGAMLSGNAMADNSNINESAYEQLKSAQIQVEEIQNMNFDSSSVKIGHSLVDPNPLKNQSESVYKDITKISFPNIGVENLDLNSNEVISPKKTEIECDPTTKENKPSDLQRISGMLLKGVGVVVAFSSGGSAMPVSWALNKAGDMLKANSCTKYDLVKDGVVDIVDLATLGSSAVINTVATIATEMTVEHYVEKANIEKEKIEIAAREKIDAENQIKEIANNVNTDSEILDESENEISLADLDLSNLENNSNTEETIKLQIDKRIISEALEKDVSSEIKLQASNDGNITSLNIDREALSLNSENASEISKKVEKRMSM